MPVYRQQKRTSDLRVYEDPPLVYSTHPGRRALGLGGGYPVRAGAGPPLKVGNVIISLIGGGPRVLPWRQAAIRAQHNLLTTGVEPVSEFLDDFRK